MSSGKSILRAEQLNCTFHRNPGLPGKRQTMYAVRDVSLQLQAGETLGIVGESGCGKSTLARMLVGLAQPSSGNIILFGENIETRGKKLAKNIQYIFQDPIASLNPRKTIQQILEAPLLHLGSLNKARRQARILELIDAVGLRKEHLQRYPHEFSGGQAQRIGIARALMVQPKILVLDEPVSALDVSIQAQILKLLQKLKKEFQLSYIFISHDLSVVEHISDRVMVMYFGSIVEQADYHSLFNNPKHPYTELLMQSAPRIEITNRSNVNVNQPSSPAPDFVLNELPNPYAPPPGCSFYARCRYRTDECNKIRPLITEGNTLSMHHYACLHPITHNN